MPEKTVEAGLENQEQTFFTEEQQERVNALVGKARTSERKKYENYEEYKAAYEELQKLKDSQKTEMERVVQRAEKAEAELDSIKKAQEREAWRNEISKQSGVPVEAIAGETREEMAERAEALKKYFSNKTPYVGSDGFAPTDGKKNTRDQFAAAIGDLI